MTSVADTRLLGFLEFPPNEEIRERTRDFFEKELRKKVVLPTIVLTEFIKVAGIKFGEEGAKNRIRQLKEKGLQIVPLNEEQALTAGHLLLSYQNVPIGDAIIASVVKTGVADYVLTDDPHFKALGIKTKWL